MLRFLAILGAVGAAILFAAPGPVGEACNPFRLVAANNTNPTLIAAGHRQVASVALGSNNAAYYFHIYDKATAPTPGTDVPVQTFPVLAQVNGFVQLALEFPINLINGLGIGASANVDGTGNMGASAPVINVCWL